MNECNYACVSALVLSNHHHLDQTARHASEVSRRKIELGDMAEIGYASRTAGNNES